jgi:hypothetical protein
VIKHKLERNVMAIGTEQPFQIFIAARVQSGGSPFGPNKPVDRRNVMLQGNRITEILFAVVQESTSVVTISADDACGGKELAEGGEQLRAIVHLTLSAGDTKGLRALMRIPWVNPTERYHLLRMLMSINKDGVIFKLVFDTLLAQGSAAEQLAKAYVSMDKWCTPTWLQQYETDARKERTRATMRQHKDNKTLNAVLTNMVSALVAEQYVAVDECAGGRASAGGVVPVVDEAALSLLNRFPAGGTGLAAIALYNGQHNGMTGAELSMACKGARLPSSGGSRFHEKLVFLWAHVKDPELMQRLVHTHKKSKLLALLQPCYQKGEMVEGLIEVQLALEEMVDVVCECEREGGEGGGVLDAWSLGAEKEKGKKKRKRAAKKPENEADKEEAKEKKIAWINPISLDEAITKFHAEPDRGKKYRKHGLYYINKNEIKRCGPSPIHNLSSVWWGGCEGGYQYIPPTAEQTAGWVG